MEGGFVGDSTYGSLSGRQSSSSSFTMSLSGSDTFEDHPSTSGCSSDMTNTKEKRKQRVKQYLRELKAMVPPKGKIGKLGTVSALQHVVNSMKKIQEENRGNQYDDKDVLEAGLSKTLFDFEENLCDKSLSAKACLHITLALKDLTVKQVSSNISEILGYPVKSWQHRSLRNFVLRKDMVILSNSLSASAKSESGVGLKIDNNDPSKTDGKKTFYFRIRHYKNLLSGYNLVKKDQFTAFQATVLMTNRKPNYVSSSSKESADDSPVSVEEMDSHKRIGDYALLECVPLKSAYLDANRSKEEMTFNTRHTLFCSYSYIHPRAIPLLGYLPQDMNGMSIFDFYHPDDTESLYNTYKQVVNLRGTPFKSPPFRLRTRNGCWVYVETEWSSFTNPWSHRLEFIIGQHTVVRGPDKPNIFNEQQNVPINESSENVQKLQQKIRELLFKRPMSKEHITSVTSNDIVKKEISSDAVLDEEPEWKKDFGDENSHKHQPKTSLKSDSMASSDETYPPQDELSALYDQLNYTNNIKRFLSSQPGSFSSSNGSDPGPSAPREDSNFDVITIIKPPSFGSSTKVLLSEQEQREDLICGSPSHHMEETVTEESTAVKETVVQNVPSLSEEQIDQGKILALTQDVLIRHTKIQEKMYVRCSRQDRKFPSPVTSSRSGNAEANRMKRSHSPDVLDRGIGKLTKTSGVDDDNFLTPPFPLCNLDSLQTRQALSQGLNSKSISRDGLSGIYPAGIPVVPLHTQGISSGYTNYPSQKQQWQSLQQPPTSSQGAMQWLYYPQQGVSFFPQVMTGFYQPFPNLSQSSEVSRMYQPNNRFDSCTSGTNSGINTTDQGLATSRQRPHCSVRHHDSGVSQSMYTIAGDNKRCKIHSSSLSSEFSSSAEDTSSSILYLLEPDNPNSNSSVEDMRTSKSRNKLNISGPIPRLTEPLWLQNVNWTSKLAMTYMMPKCKKNRILKKDRDAIMKQKNSSYLIEQMNNLQKEIAEKQKWQTIDEEQDFLFVVSDEEKEETSEFKAHNGEDGNTSDCSLDHNHGIDNINLSALSFDKDDLDRNIDSNVKSVCEKSPEDSSTTEGRLETESRDNDCHMMCDLEMQQKLDVEVSSTEYESDYSKSSDITPSDQRSSEEAGSSLKESDLSSKSSQEGSNERKDSEKCSELKDSEADNGQKNLYDSLFAPVPVKFLNKYRAKAPWLVEAEMNKTIEMKYQINISNLQSRISDDQRHMKCMEQPDLVKKQLGLMMEETGQTMHKSCLGRSNKMSSTLTSDQEHGLTVMDDSLFEGLFLNLFEEDTSQKLSSENKISDAREMMFSLDGVD